MTLDPVVCRTSLLLRTSRSLRIGFGHGSGASGTRCGKAPPHTPSHSVARRDPEPRKPCEAIALGWHLGAWDSECVSGFGQPQHVQRPRAKEVDGSLGEEEAV